jgi:hypothetical protein
MVSEGSLKWMQVIAAGCDAFDGRHLVLVGLDRKHQASARGMAVEQDRAGPADSMLAAHMRASQAELVP